MTKKLKIGLMPFVEEMVGTILNGNTTYALEEIKNLPKGQAMTVVGYVLDQLHDGNGERSEAYSAFLRRLEAKMFDG